MNAVAFRNVKFISHSDQGGRGDGVQIMVHRGYAYIGHGYSNGISVIDVRDPKNPRPAAFVPCPPNTRAIHLQTHDDLLLAVNGPSMWTMQIDPQAYYSGSPADLLKGRQYTAGVRVYDKADQVVGRQLRQHFGVDIVVAESGLISFETQASQPDRNVHQASPNSSSCAFASFRSCVSKPSVNQP